MMIDIWPQWFNSRLAREEGNLSRLEAKLNTDNLSGQIRPQNISQSLPTPHQVVLSSLWVLISRRIDIFFYSETQNKIKNKTLLQNLSRDFQIHIKISKGGAYLDDKAWTAIDFHVYVELSGCLYAEIFKIIINDVNKLIYVYNYRELSPAVWV